MIRTGLLGILLVLSVGACAHGSSEGAEPAGLPMCAEDVVGVRPEMLQDRSASEIKETIASLGWIAIESGSEVVAVDRPPRLANTGKVQRALVSHFPTDLRDRRIGGSVTFFVWLDPEGNLVRKAIAKGSRYPAFDRAAANVVSVMEFSPAATETCRVAFWNELVVNFEAHR